MKKLCRVLVSVAFVSLLVSLAYAQEGGKGMMEKEKGMMKEGKMTEDKKGMKKEKKGTVKKTSEAKKETGMMKAKRRFEPINMDEFTNLPIAMMYADRNA